MLSAVDTKSILALNDSLFGGGCILNEVQIKPKEVGLSFRDYLSAVLATGYRRPSLTVFPWAYFQAL